MKTTHQTEVFLHPGEWHFGNQNTVIRTLLGSCVSITLWHPKLRIGGMCHYLLAERNHTGGQHLSGRYGNEVILLLLQEMLHTGRPIKEFRAKLIGGAAVLPNIERDLPIHDVPSRNIDIARRMVQQLGIPIQAEDLGGGHPRLVVFDIDTGDVWVRQPNEANTTPPSTKKTRIHV